MLDGHAVLLLLLLWAAREAGGGGAGPQGAPLLRLIAVATPIFGLGVVGLLLVNAGGAAGGQDVAGVGASLLYPDLRGEITPLMIFFLKK